MQHSDSYLLTQNRSVKFSRMVAPGVTESVYSKSNLSIPNVSIPIPFLPTTFYHE